MYSKKKIIKLDCGNIYNEISLCYYEKNNNPDKNCLPIVKKLLACINQDKTK